MEPCRKYLRIPPAAENPVTIILGREGQFPKAKVFEISLGGVSLEAASVAGDLRPGTAIDHIEIFLPEEQACIVSGKVASVRGSRVGIEFTPSGESELNKIARYVLKREIELLNIQKDKRVAPLPKAPVKMKLSEKEFQPLSAHIRLLEIGVGGMTFEVFGAEALLKPGVYFDRVELSLPGEEEPCFVSGRITAVKGMHHDAYVVEFQGCRRADLLKVSQFVSRREVEDAASEQAEASAPKEPEARLRAPGTGARKILLIDDSAPIQDSYSEFFFECGFAVLQARDGAEGIKLALGILPDLILMDINMPVLNGIEATRVISSHPSTKGIPIFMFTTEGEKDAVIKAIQVGAKDYIVKTGDKNLVLKRIRRFFDEKK